MSGSIGFKEYGREGPPQLRGHTEDISPEDLAEWLVGDTNTIYALKSDRWWRKRLVCSCGSCTAFEVWHADSSVPGWVSGQLCGFQRTELRCSDCHADIELFDDGLHGYNAVVCGDRMRLPQYYIEANLKLLRLIACNCRSTTFTVIAAAMYDCGDNLKDTPIDQWDDAYGAFAAVARCSACGKIRLIAESETA